MAYYYFSSKKMKHSPLLYHIISKAYNKKIYVKKHNNIYLLLLTY